MKIIEIAPGTRKTIKKLQALYLSFIFDYSKYEELIAFIDQCKLSTDVEIAKEAKMIDSKLMADLIRMLKK
jgi:hypothetical protein